MATMDQSVICVGIHRSGPIFLEMSWDGTSAQRKDTRKIVFPRTVSICSGYVAWVRTVIKFCEDEYD
jgi:hypothetical protein